MTNPWAPVRHLLCGAAAASLAAGGAGAAPAQRTAEDPPLLSEVQAAPKTALKAATGAPDHPGDNIQTLRIVYTPGELYNPATAGKDAVNLRSYQGATVDPSRPYAAPMIVAEPGSMVRLNLSNELPADPSCQESAGHAPNEPHCFNGTNLHSHGLWVNPSGNGDNVLLSINPGVKFTYEYNIPPEHPAGTFWYHTHRHGSTALQVSSGMAGALIIRGDRKPTGDRPGDLDVLTGGMKERVVVFQQIQYACRAPAPAGQKLGPIKQTVNGRYICGDKDVGGIEAYDQFGPGTWASSGRTTSVNGVVWPIFEEAKQGSVERWRMIHGGVRDTITLQFRKAKKGRLTGATLPKAPDQAKFIAQNCEATPIDFAVVAADGLTMEQAQVRRSAVFQPGYRWDALVVFPDAGAYCVIDAASPENGTVNNVPAPPQFVGLVRVAAGSPATGGVAATVQRTLEDAARKAELGAMEQPVLAGLADRMRLSSFVPHPDVKDGELTGSQELTFFIDVSGSPVKFEVGNTLQTADAKPYDPNRTDRQLPLGGVEEWTLQSHFVSHPFHIHVNPFQIVSITDPNGKDVSALGAVDDAGEDGDTQYPGLKGVWKDTLWIKSLLPGNLPKGFSGLYTIKIRTRYQRYIGTFVLHCHILDHEDQGMMQNVAVVLPAGSIAATAKVAAAPSGAAHAGHDH